MFLFPHICVSHHFNFNKNHCSPSLSFFCTKPTQQIPIAHKPNSTLVSLPSHLRSSPTSTTDPHCTYFFFRATRSVHHPTKEIRGAKKFTHDGIEPSLKLKFDRIYSRIIATVQYALAPLSDALSGNEVDLDTSNVNIKSIDLEEESGHYTWAPLSGTLSGNKVDLGTSNVNIKGFDLEEGSKDLEEDVLMIFANDIARSVNGVHISSSSNTWSCSKRKERDHHESRTGKKRSSKISVQMLLKWDQLIESMLTKSDYTSARMDQLGCSILEVMAELHSISRVSDDDDFHDFTTEYHGL